MCSLTLLPRKKALTSIIMKTKNNNIDDHYINILIIILLLLDAELHTEADNNNCIGLH